MSWILTITPSAGIGSEVIYERLWSLDTTGIAETSDHGSVTLIAGFTDCLVAEHAAAALEQESMGACSVAPVDPNAWQSPEPQRITVGNRELTIEVGHAFGHGHHPTTALALDALPRLITPGVSVLDVGTGTGILALAAAVLGARPVVGVDIDPEAIQVAGRNAAANDLDIIVTDLPLDALDTTVDMAVFDVVVVNMLAADLAPIAEQVVERIRLGGTLFVTGFLHHQRTWVDSLFPSCEQIEAAGNDDWACVLLRRTAVSELAVSE